MTTCSARKRRSQGASVRGSLMAPPSTKRSKRTEASCSSRASSTDRPGCRRDRRDPAKWRALAACAAHRHLDGTRMSAGPQPSCGVENEGTGVAAHRPCRGGSRPPGGAGRPRTEGRLSAKVPGARSRPCADSIRDTARNGPVVRVLLQQEQRPDAHPVRRVREQPWHRRRQRLAPRRASARRAPPNPMHAAHVRVHLHLMLCSGLSP